MNNLVPLLAGLLLLVGCDKTPSPTEVCDPTWDAAKFLVECVQSSTRTQTHYDDADDIITQCSEAVRVVCPKVQGFWRHHARAPCSFAATKEERASCAEWLDNK